MKFIRFILAIFICIILFSNPSISQESSAEGTKQNRTESVDEDRENIFYKVPDGNNKEVFNKAVTEHIVINKGIQDFYAVPFVETKWLDSIINSEIDWHEKLQKLEKTYRKTFQRRAQLRSGQNDRSVRIENYTQNISKLEKEIAEIRRQIVQINVDQQVFISSLSKTPITALVAVKSLYTPDLMSNKKKLDILNSTFFKSMEEIREKIEISLTKNTSNKHYFGRDFNISKSENGFIQFEDDIGKIILPEPNILGEHQLYNISTSIAAARKIFKVKDDDIKKGIQSIELKGRLQEIKKGKTNKSL